MANVTVRHVIDVVAGILQDENSTQTDRSWPEDELIDYYNLEQRKIVSMAPAANPITEAIKLATGTKQSIPAKGIALINVIRNMGTDGLVPGMAITPTLESVIKSFDLNWSTRDSQETIWNIFPSNQDKTVFYNYPPSDGTGYIQIEFSQVPVTVVWDEDGDWENILVEVKEQYVNALFPGILARAYDKDTDFPGNAERAAGYDAEFMAEVGQV